MDSGQHPTNSTVTSKTLATVTMICKISNHWHLSTHSAVKIHNHYAGADENTRPWPHVWNTVQYIATTPTSKSLTSARARHEWWSSRLRRFWLLEAGTPESRQIRGGPRWVQTSSGIEQVKVGSAWRKAQWAHYTPRSNVTRPTRRRSNRGSAQRPRKYSDDHGARTSRVAKA